METTVVYPIREVVTEFAASIAHRCGLFGVGEGKQSDAAVLPEVTTRLTSAQRDRIDSFSRQWIETTRRTATLTDEQWSVWETGARKCYEAQRAPWPGVVVRVSSPIVSALAPTIAAWVGRLRTLPREALIDAAGALNGRRDPGRWGGVGVA